MPEITLTDEELQLVFSTFKARKIRVNEWITEAKKAKKPEDVERWEDLQAAKTELVKNIRKQVEEQS